MTVLDTHCEESKVVIATFNLQYFTIREHSIFCDRIAQRCLYTSNFDFRKLRLFVRTQASTRVTTQRFVGGNTPLSK